MTKLEAFGIATLVTIVAAALVLLTQVGEIHAWEKANGYPYGKLCDVFHNCAR